MTVDGLPVVLEKGMTVYDAARQAGVDIPVLCHRDGLHPAGGCGVCTVEDKASARLLPACVTRAEHEMVIETGTDCAVAARKDALELLLSDHLADCEPPCEIACPSGLPIMRMLRDLAEGRVQEAAALARQYPCVCGPEALCEKACRRKALGGAVAIRALHLVLAGDVLAGQPDSVTANRREPPRFRSWMTGLNETMLPLLCHEIGPRQFCDDAPFVEISSPAVSYEARRCMQCGCLKPNDCRLRELCAQVDARQRTFKGASRAVIRRHSRGFRFDSARCVLCGICVRYAQQVGASIAPAFHGRGFNEFIGPPLGRTWDDVPEEILSACAAACPTGAMTFQHRQ
ncbi:MAG: 2Fe-2S iron-sulfur cluster-binding protein [Kiritimatiellae bacterium]|nr:2Fe-2S iron-sulfur cluster-binding protein [Kiritimatiellia bacterium]